MPNYNEIYENYREREIDPRIKDIFSKIKEKDEHLLKVPSYANYANALLHEKKKCLKNNCNNINNNTQYEIPYDYFKKNFITKNKEIPNG